MSATPTTLPADLPAADPREVSIRAAELLHIHQDGIWRRTDRLFMGLLVFQWVFGICLALWLSPKTWDGATSQIHPHVYQAIFMGLAIIASPLVFGWLCPGKTITRHVIAVSQALSSALLIHLGGGRIEMHFHVFGSLAFIAFYRDWRVLISATVVVAADHLLRGIYMPASVYGISDAGTWRWAEHAAWVIFEDIFLITSCLQGVREMRLIAQRQAQLEYSYRVVEDKVHERTRQLKEAQEDLMKAARTAGMAEIATSVLHNVGNVLNSLNVSLHVATSKVEQSPVSNLKQAVQLIADHHEHLGQYLTSDEQGRQIPAYLQTVSEVMAGEQTALLEEMTSLSKNVEHIKQIVNVQQTHARSRSVLETVNMGELLEDALRVAGVSASAAIVVERQLGEIPELQIDKHATLQILINLVSNAKHALLNRPQADKRLTLKVSYQMREGCKLVRVEVIDNGVGIDSANLNRIFNHGFTTKKEGHGFGLHSAANSAKRMGGSLSVTSPGLGMGANFSLELPVSTVESPVNTEVSA